VVLIRQPAFDSGRGGGTRATLKTDFYFIFFDFIFLFHFILLFPHSFGTRRVFYLIIIIIIIIIFFSPYLKEIFQSDPQARFDNPTLLMSVPPLRYCVHDVLRIIIRVPIDRERTGNHGNINTV
jgi:hypothetical protein